MGILLRASIQDVTKGRVSGTTVDTLRKDAENQKAIMAKKGKNGAKGPTGEALAHSMTPHLAMHSTRGVESGRGRREAKKQKAKYQKSVYGKLKLPPDEATPFFTTYVLHYAFPTIAVICTCLGCVLLRTMKMYQKERWKGTSYFHGTCNRISCVMLVWITFALSVILQMGKPSASAAAMHYIYPAPSSSVC